MPCCASGRYFGMPTPWRNAEGNTGYTASARCAWISRGQRPRACTQAPCAGTGRGTCQEDCVWQGAVLSYEFNNSELGVCETGKSIEPRWPVGAVELRANAADRRKGGAMGQASWRSSFLGQRSAKFLPETRVR